jgi:toxin FitB
MIVLDTNVLSEAMKPAPAPAVAQWMRRERGRGLFTTAVSEAEIIDGIAILPDGRRKRDLGSGCARHPRAIRRAHSSI